MNRNTPVHLAFRPVPLATIKRDLDQDPPQSPNNNGCHSNESDSDDESDDERCAKARRFHYLQCKKAKMDVEDDTVNIVGQHLARMRGLLRAPPGVRRASRMAVAKAPTIEVANAVYSHQNNKIKQIRMKGEEIVLVGDEDFEAATATLHQRAGRTGWPRGSGYKSSDPEEQRAGERVMLLKTNPFLECHLPWAFPSVAAPSMHAEKLMRLYYTNALSNARVYPRNHGSVKAKAIAPRSSSEGAGPQVSRLAQSSLQRAAAAAASSTMLHLATIRFQLRKRGYLVLDPLASNGFDLSGAIACESTNAYALLAASITLPYNCMPVQVVSGTTYDVACIVARAQLDRQIVASAFGNVSESLDAICFSIVSPDSDAAQFDCVWAAIVLLAHVAQHPRGMILLRELVPQFTVLQLEQVRSLESYGRTEIQRRMNQANREFNKSAKQGHAVDAEEFRKQGLAADRSVLGDGVSDMRFWEWALKSPHASCLATLVAGNEDTVRDAAMRTLSKQAPASSAILYNEVVTSTAEEHAVNVNDHMDGIVHINKSKGTKMPIPHFFRFNTAVVSDQKAMLHPRNGALKHPPCSAQLMTGVNCAVAEAIGIERLPTNHDTTALHIVKRVLPEHCAAPSRESGIAMLHSLASGRLRAPDAGHCLSAHCERAAIHRAKVVATRSVAKSGLFGVGKGRHAAEAARIDRQLQVSNESDANKLLVTAATGLTRSWIVATTFFARSELDGVTDGHATTEALLNELFELPDKSGDLSVASGRFPLDAVAKGLGAAAVGRRVTAKRTSLAYPRANPCALALRVDEILRNVYRQTPSVTQFGDSPCRAQFVAPTTPTARNDAPVDHYAPIPHALLCEMNVDFMEEPSQERPETRAVVSKQICADGAVRLVDAIRDALQWRVRSGRCGAEAGDSDGEGDDGVSRVEMRKRLWQEHVDDDSANGHPLYSEITYALVHLVLLATSQASLVASFAEWITPQHMICFIANSRGVRVPDNSLALMLTCYDVLYAHRTGLEPQCIGTKYEGQYGSMIDSGWTSMGIAAHNHVSDGRLHGSAHLPQDVSNASAMRFAEHSVLTIESDQKKRHYPRPAEACGPPRRLIMGVHRVLEHAASGLEFVRTQVLRRTDDGVSDLLVTGTGPFSQQFDPDSEPGCALVQSARGTRVGSAEAAEQGRMPLLDATAEEKGLLQEPLHRRPQRTRQCDNFFKSSYEYASTTFSAAAAISKIATCLSRSPETDSPETMVANLHACISRWHESPADGVSDKYAPVEDYICAIACSLLSSIYPSNWNIGERALLEAYSRSTPLCAAKFDAWLKAANKHVQAKHAQKDEEEEEDDDEEVKSDKKKWKEGDEEDDDEDEWDEPIDVGGVPLVAPRPPRPELRLPQLLNDRPDLLDQARRRWKAFQRKETPQRCAWHSGVAPLLIYFLKADGAAPASLSEYAHVRKLFQQMTQAAWLVHSPDGWQRPPPPCPCANVDYGNITVHHTEPVYVGGLPGAPAKARTGLLGATSFNFRQLLTLLMGAHLPSLDPETSVECNYAGNEGPRNPRQSCNALIRGEHGEERTIKAISPGQCDRDTDCFGTRAEREIVCAAQCQASVLNYKLLEPTFVHLQAPFPTARRMRGRSGRSDDRRDVVRTNAAANAETTLWESNALYYMNKAATSAASAEAIRAVHEAALGANSE